MDSNSATLLPGQSPPLSVITPTDQGGVVLIVTALGMIFALISIIIRVYIRLQLRNAFARDDVVVSVAMIFAIIQSSVVFVGITEGYGKTIKDISASSLVQLQKALYTSDLLYVITLGLAKCSVSLLLLRLSPDKRHNLASKVIILATVVLTVVSLLTVALQCDLLRPWIFINARCSNLLVRWQVVAAFDIVIELALVANSIYLVHKLQLPFEKKSVVVVAFALRLPLIAPVVIRLYYLGLEFSSSDPTLVGVLATVCTQIEMSYAIVSATIPCLRPFMTSLNTHYGAPVKPKTSTGTGSGSNNLTLDSLTKAGRIIRTKQREEGGGTWDPPGNRTMVTRGGRNSMDSHESKQMIITKDTQWTVEYEGQSGSLTPRTTNQ